MEECEVALIFKPSTQKMLGIKLFPVKSEKNVRRFKAASLVFEDKQGRKISQNFSVLKPHPDFSHIKGRIEKFALTPIQGRIFAFNVLLKFVLKGSKKS